MESIHLKEVHEIQDLTKGHVLYFSKKQDQYISNVMEFVLSGLERNEYSIIIENDRMTPLIKKSLTEKLNNNCLEKVMFVNNYDFYYAKGDFRVNSIFDYLPNLIEGYSEQDLAVRSWAHVEWRDEPEVSKKLSVSEKEADLIVAKTKLLSVCAYDSERVSHELKERLLFCHNFLINE
ncbi:DcmR-like sensory protein [Cytobacillus firmus]|uniref:DcmR-like sensory protein n=2 Tax=Cytobacillus TaxID=2675230 RepID=A0A366JWK9_CYTFI|nr:MULTISPECIES: MEDS domain-containing protein [Cytobacillus]RBP92946.1 DcmR-like sensory protein [Cytobacillus firmus]TDX42548.1 DcmR-like sensory protein [Cytobacillus oceanisediminis]